MKKQLLLFILALIPLLASAYQVEIDGINYEYDSRNQWVTVTSKSPKYTGDIVIPASVTYEGVEYSVTSIGNRAFSGCSDLTSVTIPNSMVLIEGYAFAGCTGLTSITIPNSVTTIYGEAFYRCTGLTSVTIGNGVASIASHTFEDCPSLTSVTIGNGVASISEYAFSGCIGLTSINIPNSVTSIGDYAFQKCTGLSSINIPNSVTSIGYYSFRGCTGLTSITIGNGVKYILAHTFEDCIGLTSIAIGNGVKGIDGKAFSGCTGLTSITIPNNVTFVDSSSFNGCSGLTSIVVESGNSKYDSRESCNAIIEISTNKLVLGCKNTIIPNTVASIDGSAFHSCIGLTSVSIPSSVTTIDTYAFMYCNELKTIWMGNNIQSIGGGAFSYCPKIEDIYCSTVRYPKTGKDIFKESYPDYITLHVPAESVKQYKAVEPWSKFKDVVALKDDDYPSGGEGTEKCIKPTISYQSGKLKFSSATRGVEYVYEITDSDIKKDYGAEVQLTATYHISVYATKSGYQNSDVATATLCWIDQQPRTEGITNSIAQVPANAVLIQSNDGILTIQGTDDGTPISVYTINGQQAGSTFSQDGQATIATNLQKGSVAIVKIGKKSVKVIVK